jgi:hypothetical protein
LEKDFKTLFKETYLTNRENFSALNSIPKISNLETLISSYLRLPTTEKLEKVLGDFSLAEMTKITLGADTIFSLNTGATPTFDNTSLLGKYIAETGAWVDKRAFPVNPDNNKILGPTKLIVAVSIKSFPTFLKYFNLPEFLFHYHQPSQGTLKLFYRGHVGTYAKVSNPIAINDISMGTIFPMIMFKTSEGERVNNFFEMGKINAELGQYPWNLVGFCGQGGGYNSCTHWVANIPVGDELVENYTFPGKVDSYAYRRVKQSDEGLTYQLGDYEYKKNKKYTPAQKWLIESVWKQGGKSNQQLSLLLDDKVGQVQGLWANPGYVAYRLLGTVSSERVPIVFVMTKDHTKKISDKWFPDINAY